MVGRCHRPNFPLNGRLAAVAGQTVAMAVIAAVDVITGGGHGIVLGK